MKYWVNGGLVESDGAAISVLDHGFTVADGVFETLAVWSGQPFALTRHLRRLTTSATGLGLPAPEDTVVREACQAVCSANLSEIGDVGRLRITYTSGSAPLGSERGDHGCTLVVAAAPTGAWPATATVAVVPWPRNERSPVAGLKTTSYAENVMALAAAKRLGAGEALMPNTRGELCEGTGSNVFVAVEGRLLTPPLSSGALGGITRELVIEWCRRDMEVLEAELPLEVLNSADEVFITSSTRNVQPVSRIVGELPERELKAPGELTIRAARIFAQRAAADIDP